MHTSNSLVFFTIFNNNYFYANVIMQRDKTIEQDFKENQTRIRLSRMSVEAVKKKPLQFKQPRVYSLEDPVIEQNRLERKLQQSLDSISTIANRNPQVKESYHWSPKKK